MIRVQGLDPDPAKVVNPGDNVKGFARVLAVLVRATGESDEIPANIVCFVPIPALAPSGQGEKHSKKYDLHNSLCSPCLVMSLSLKTSIR